MEGGSDGVYESVFLSGVRYAVAYSINHWLGNVCRALLADSADSGEVWNIRPRRWEVGTGVECVVPTRTVFMKDCASEGSAGDR